MQRTWMETVQLLGLDIEVGLILLMLVLEAAWRGLASLRIPKLRPPEVSADATDPWPPQEWRPSH
jgi:hypothetical protein